MDQEINITTVKKYLHVLYSDFSRKDEAEEFFNTLINSESYCSSLLELLMEIIINDPDENFKKISIILINQMNLDLIIESIFLLNQKLDPTFYQIIEILTDFITSKKSNELIELINQTLSSSNDILILKAVLQLISSINYKIESKEIEIENYENILSIYYEHFIEINNSLMQQEIIDLNQQVFFYYFMKSFSKTIVKLNQIDFFHTFACFCLNLKITNELFNDVIEMIVETFSYLITDSDPRIFEFIRYLDEYCKSTEFIPSSSLNLWGFFLKFIPEIDFSSFDLHYFLSNYIFPFFKFQPQLMIDDPEKFLDEYDPDVFSDLNLRKFINNFVTCVKFEPIYEIINQFSNSDFNENFEEDPIEVCRILHFFSIFNQSLCDGNKENLMNFLLEKIPILIEKIGQNSEMGQFLIIGICLFIKRVINYSTSSLLENQNIAEIIIKFLKNSIITNFDENKNVSDLIFYFSINAIVSVSRATSIEYFEFNEFESNHIFMNVCRIFGEINNNTFSSTFDFLMENMSKMNINIHDFVKNMWEMRNENYLYLNENIFHVLTTLFINCKEMEEKQSIFIDLFSLVLNEIESTEDFLIGKFYLNVLYLFVQTFTSSLLDCSEKVPLFIDTVGKLIYQMLFNISQENYPSYLEYPEGFDELVSRYKYFIYEIVQYIDDPTFCIDSLINPFVIPIFIKLNELSNIRGFEINFTGFNCLLIKFKGNEDIFHLLFALYNDFAIQSNMNQYSKVSFLTSLIISNPSLLFQSLNHELFYELINENLPQMKFDIHFYAIKTILEHLISDENSDSTDLISALAQSFYNRVENDESCINGDFVINYQLKSASFHYNIYNEGFNDIVSAIIDIFKKHGIEFQFNNNDE